MATSLGHELAWLQRQTVAELRARYAELFQEATRTQNKVWLLRRIAWRLQALAQGDLSQRARQRAAALAQDADLRLMPPRLSHAGAAARADAPRAGRRRDRRLPGPGTVLTRRYHGQTLEVEVRADGFAFQGQLYRSLSAVAQAITGAHWNGFHFFGLGAARRSS